MDEIGIRPGVRTSGLDAELLEQAAMVKLKDVSWMAINFQGSVVNVELKERDAPPEAIPMEEPCNLKSSYPGQIVRLEVISGVTVVEEGDAVTQGQLLVSGVFEDLLEGKKPLPARQRQGDRQNPEAAFRGGSADPNGTGSH